MSIRPRDQGSFGFAQDRLRDQGRRDCGPTGLRDYEARVRITCANDDVGLAGKGVGFPVHFYPPANGVRTFVFNGLYLSPFPPVHSLPMSYELKSSRPTSYPAFFGFLRPETCISW